MKNWYLKTFKKKDAVHIYIVTPDRRVKDFWTIPDEFGHVSWNGYSFVLTKKAQALKNNVPTYFFNTENADPIDVVNKRTRHMTAQEFHMAIDSHVAKDILKASGGDAFSKEFIITLIVMFMGFAGMFYIFNGQFNELRQLIETIPQVTTPIIGG